MMEASQAGLAQSNGGEGGEGQAQQSGPDLNALAETLGSLSQGQEQLREFLQSQPWQQQAEPEAEPEQEYGLFGSEDGYAEEDPQAVERRVEQYIQKQIQNGVQQSLNPVQEQVAEMRREREAEAIVNEFPELSNPETAQQVVNTARQLAEANGHPELAAEPWLWRLTFMSMAAAEQANQEGSNDPNAAHLEGAGGAGSAAPQMSPMEFIMQGRDDEGLGASALPFG